LERHNIPATIIPGFSKFGKAAKRVMDYELQLSAVFYQ
jgi:hypothetical protein